MIASSILRAIPARHPSFRHFSGVCNLNIVSSPYPPIMDSSHYKPVPEFVSVDWTGPTLAKKVAIRDGNTGETRTFSDYNTYMHNIASALRYEYLLKPTDTVALLSPNNIDYLPICLATAMCGAKVTPLNPLYKADEVVTILDRSSSKVLFTHTKLLSVALPAVMKSKTVDHIVVIPDAEKNDEIPFGSVDFRTLVEYKHSPNLENSVDDVHYHVKDVNSHPWLLPYSSGTTGLPKGVCLSHGNMISNLLQMDEAEGMVFPMDHKLISPLPFFHIYGFLASLLYCGWRGQELITMSDRFDLPTFCKLVEDHKPDRAHLVPPIILGLAKHPIVDKFDLSSMKMIISAAAPLGKDTEDAARKRLGSDVKQAWGMSELSPLGTMNSDYNAKTGSIGQLVSSTYGKILDSETGKSLGPHEQGELVIKGPQVMMGYLNEPDKTRECLSDDGWLRTGDMAYYDDDGFFYITDRIKELIKVRGFPVAPAELEELLLTNENVADVAVIQVPNDAAGELPRAYVVLKPTADPKKSTEQSLKNWVRERVAPQKRLEGGIKFLQEIPKSASGKILRRVLRDEAKKEFE